MHSPRFFLGDKRDFVAPVSVVPSDILFWCHKLQGGVIATALKISGFGMAWNAVLVSGCFIQDHPLQCIVMHQPCKGLECRLGQCVLLYSGSSALSLRQRTAFRGQVVAPPDMSFNLFSFSVKTTQVWNTFALWLSWYTLSFYRILWIRWIWLKRDI